MKTTNQSVKNKIEDLMIDRNTEEAINYAFAHGVTAKEFESIARNSFKK